MIRGDIWYYTFKIPDKRRPALILTRTSAIPFLNEVTVAPLTTKIRDNETSVWLDENDGMREACAINLDYIHTVPKAKVGTVIAHISDEKMQEVLEAIKFAFGFDQ